MPLVDLLAVQSAELQAELQTEYWQTLTGAAQQLAGSDGSVQGGTKAICVVGQRSEGTR